MSNMLFNAGLAALAQAGFDNLTIKALLERDTSEWVPGKDDATLSACTGLVEVSAAGYSRASLANPAATVDNENDRVNCDTDDGTFGEGVASGQSFIAILYYIEIDGTPENDIPLYRQDTGLGVDLPAPCQNGAVTVTIEDLIRILSS